MIAKTLDLTTQEINLLLPKSQDQIEAIEENKLLSENKITDGEKSVVFDVMQDHDAHIREHMKGKQTKAMRKHIELHYEAKKLAKQNPEFAMLSGNEQGQLATQEQSTPNQAPV